MGTSLFGTSWRLVRGQKEQYGRYLKVIYDVCNPAGSFEALHQDMATATVLPCRIAVYSKAGGSMIATVKPTDLFAATGLQHSDTLARR